MGNNDSAVRAATAIFDEHGEFIRVILRHQAGSGLDIEDLFQEFYLALLHKPVPAEVQDVRGYLYRAIVHHVISAARRRGTYSKAMKKYAKEAKISINNRGAEDAFISEEHQNATVANWARYLQDREAEAFVMKYRDECSIPEIATKMGIDRRTVSRYLSEGLRKLHRRLAPE